MTVFLLQVRALPVLWTAEQKVSSLGAAPGAATAEEPPGILGHQQPLLLDEQQLPGTSLGTREGNVT